MVLVQFYTVSEERHLDGDIWIHSVTAILRTCALEGESSAEVFLEGQGYCRHEDHAVEVTPGTRSHLWLMPKEDDFSFKSPEGDPDNFYAAVIIEPEDIGGSSSFYADGESAFDDRD